VLFLKGLALQAVQDMGMGLKNHIRFQHLVILNQVPSAGGRPIHFHLFVQVHRSSGLWKKEENFGIKAIMHWANARSNLQLLLSPAFSPEQ
jgi:hypothetical protein